ncbi:MAG TPA: FapA family protein, partial [Spirochaetota bacterium]|nr:FapA family protein [Spirochaetota bacterium]
TKTGKLPSYTDIEEALHGYKILARIEQQKIEEQLKAIELGNPRFTRILVAQGREPAHGHEEYFLPLINLSKKAGEIKSDGSIDFKEVGSIIEIKKYQDILRRVPAVKPADGYDVFGDKIFAEFLRHDGYYKGDNIEQGKEDENIFVSSIDGCVDVDGKKISVLPVAYIHGDVNYDTGNIDFDGSVHITGSVLPGFTVKARGDIIIEKNVDDAFIEAQGDITVKMGVVGKENVKLTANGKITVKYLLNAKVEAAGDIVIEDSIINSDVFSNSKISVIARQGKIIGGKATALYEIQVNVSGSPNETETLLSVGRNLFIEKELAAIHKEIAKWRNAVDETMRKLKVSFGEAVFDNPKEFISKLIPAKQKSCLLMLKELSANNKELKKMMEQSKEIQDKLKLEREPCIIIKNKAYPGTIISIKKNTKRLESPIDNVKYYEDPDEKIIRFSPAV